MRHDQSVVESANEAQETGETLLFYFYSQGCSFCEEIKDSFAEFLERTDIKVLAYTFSTAPNYTQAENEFKSIAEENAKVFFREWGTPLLFSYKDGSFTKIPLYGNHGSAKSIALMMQERYSFPYLYEFSSLSAAQSFLKKGYPVYLLNEEESLPDALLEEAKKSAKPFGFLPKSALGEESKQELEEAYGSYSCLLLGEASIKKEDCSSYIEDYYAS